MVIESVEGKKGHFKLLPILRIRTSLIYSRVRIKRTSQVAQWLRICLQFRKPPEMQKTRVQYLGLERALEKEMATDSSILAWEIPWTEEPGGLQSTWPQGRTWLSKTTAAKN